MWEKMWENLWKFQAKQEEETKALKNKQQSSTLSMSSRGDTSKILQIYVGYFGKDTFGID